MGRKGYLLPLLIGICAAGLFVSTLGIGAQPADPQQAPQVQAPRGQPGQPGQPGRAGQAGQAGAAGRGTGFPGMGRGAAPRAADPKDIVAMAAALPAAAAVKPKQPRRILILNRCNGFVTSSIPLATVMLQMIGDKTGAWSADASWDADVINEENLKKYDVVLLNSTTGAFLDEADNPAVTAARRKALRDYVRNGKGIVGLHGAVDAYRAQAPRAAAGGAPGAPGAPGGAARGAAGGAPPAPAGGAAPRAAGAGSPMATQPVSSWPEFTKMMNGLFKYHWTNQLCHVKIDDPASPINASFKGQTYQITDETYTYGQDSYSRTNAHILTSLDYSKMSDEDKAKEPAGTKRTDGDYGISWIRREGKGRVFYEAHGHMHHVFAITPWIEHLIAGIQYAAGDLEADDSPSVKPR